MAECMGVVEQSYGTKEGRGKRSPAQRGKNPAGELEGGFHEGLATSAYFRRACRFVLPAHPLAKLDEVSHKAEPEPSVEASKSVA
jgi:hypothetical protein